MKQTIFKVKDKVFDIRYGWGDVIEIVSSEYPVWVEYDRCQVLYTKDGRPYSAANPTLSFTEYTLDGFTQERPEEPPEEGQVVWARNDNWKEGVWFITHFVKYTDGKYLCSRQNPLGGMTPYDQITTENPNK